MSYAPDLRPVEPKDDNGVLRAKRGDRVLGPCREKGRHHVPACKAAIAVDWADPVPQPSPDAVAMELPDQTVWLLHDDVLFEMPITFADAYQALRSAFILGGADAAASLLQAPCASAQEDLFSEAASSAEASGGIRRGSDYPTPQAVATDEAVSAARTLMEEAHEALLQRAEEHVEGATQLFREAALARLDAARDQIRKESNLYFGSASPFALDVLLRVATHDLNGPAEGLTSLRRALGPIQDQHRVIGELDGNRREIVAAQRGPEERNLPASERQRRAESLRKVDDDLEAARARLTEMVLVVGRQFPIAWKIWSRAHLDPKDASALERDILDALRSCTSANDELRRVIERDPDAVWKYPAVIEAALNAHSAPQFCLARAACGERMAAARAGQEAIGRMGLVTGAASLLVLIAGSIVASPIVVSVMVADSLLSVASAGEQYFEYVREAAAFGASLDPAQALGAEPNLASAALGIALDLFGAVPL